MNTYIILRRSGWSSRVELEKAAEVSSRVGQEMKDRVRWIRSYITREANDRVGTVCIYQAKDSAAIRDHAQRANLPCDAIVPVGNTFVINADPLIPSGEPAQ